MSKHRKPIRLTFAMFVTLCSVISSVQAQSQNVRAKSGSDREKRTVPAGILAMDGARPRLRSLATPLNRSASGEPPAISHTLGKKKTISGDAPLYSLEYNLVLSRGSGIRSRLDKKGARLTPSLFDTQSIISYRPSYRMTRERFGENSSVIPRRRLSSP